MAWAMLGGGSVRRRLCTYDARDMTRREWRFATLALIAVLAVGLGLALSGGWRSAPPPATARPTASIATAGASASPGVTSSPTPTTPAGSPSPAGLKVTWRRITPSGVLPASRQGHTWTVDPDMGVAYLFGGLATTDGNSPGSTLGDLWAYDLGADTWTRVLVTGPAPSPRSGHVAAWIDGFGLVVIGGRDAEGSPLDDSWRFDPSTSSWQPLNVEAPLPPARYGSCAAVDGGGGLWLIDGAGSAGESYADSWRYEPAAGRWEIVAATSPPHARAGHVCWVGAADRLHLFGGKGTTVTADLWAIDVGSSEPTWEVLETDAGISARTGAAITIHDDRAVIVGGLDERGEVLADVGISATDGNTIDPVPAEGAPSAGRARAALIDDPANERILLFGGFTGSAVTDEIWQAVIR
jgi:N-acetylneuraminic acid mutarotase